MLILRRCHSHIKIRMEDETLVIRLYSIHQNDYNKNYFLLCGKKHDYYMFDIDLKPFNEHKQACKEKLHGVS